MAWRRTTILVGIGTAFLVLGVLFRARSSDSALAPRTLKNYQGDVVVAVPRVRSDHTLPGVNRLQAPPKRKPTSQEIMDWLNSLYSKHERSFRELPSSAGRFEAEQALYFREARLAAFVFPVESESVATPIALNANEANRPERYFAIVTLAQVAHATGSTTALATLQTLLQDSDRSMADVALAGIAGTDPQGSRKSLYWEACRRFSPTAYEIVSAWYDSGTISEMNSLNRNGQNSHANEVLRRMNILAGEKTEDALVRIIRTQNTQDIATFSWALKVGKIGDPPPYSKSCGNVWIQASLRPELAGIRPETVSSLSRKPIHQMETSPTSRATRCTTMFFMHYGKLVAN